MKRLFAALAAFLGTPAPSQAEPPKPKPKPMDVPGFQKALEGAQEAELDLAGFLELRQKGKVIVLDVRSAQAYADLHIDGALNAPLTDLTEKTLPKLLPDKDAPIALMCDYSLGPTRMIAMTIQAYPVLKANGYKHIYRLNLWKGPNQQMISQAEIAKSVTLVGTQVKP
jgi:hypothetical protein